MTNINTLSELGQSNEVILRGVLQKLLSQEVSLPNLDDADTISLLFAKQQANTPEYTNTDLFAMLENWHLPHLSELKSLLSGLVKSGEVSAETIKYFFLKLPKLKFVSAHLYNQLVYLDDRVEDLSAKSRIFLEIIEKLIQQHNLEITPGNGFVGFNSRAEADSVARLYLTFDLNNDPSQALASVFSVLDKLDLIDKISFKVSQGLSNRHDQIVFYFDKDEVGLMDVLVQEISSGVDAHLMSGEQHPVAINKDRGIATAIDALEVNKIIQSAGGDTISYTELIASLIEMSYRLAKYELEHKDLNRPISIRNVAERYFKEFLKLVTEVESL